MKTYEEIDENGDDIHYNSDGTRLVLNAAQEKYVTDWHNNHDAHPGPLWLSDASGVSLTASLVLLAFTAFGFVCLFYK